MDKINKNRINEINYQGIKPVKGEGKSMEQSLKKMVNQILVRAEREVPEYGDFAPVYEEIKNISQSLCPTDYVLKISKLPKEIKNNETTRVLELVAYKLPAPYKASRAIAYGTKEEILNQLKSEEIFTKVEQTAKDLSEDLSDM